MQQHLLHSSGVDSLNPTARPIFVWGTSIPTAHRPHFIQVIHLFLPLPVLWCLFSRLGCEIPWAVDHPPSVMSIFGCASSNVGCHQALRTLFSPQLSPLFSGSGWMGNAHVISVWMLIRQYQALLNHSPFNLEGESWTQGQSGRKLFIHGVCPTAQNTTQT